MMSWNEAIALRILQNWSCVYCYIQFFLYTLIGFFRNQNVHCVSWIIPNKSEKTDCEG